MNIEPFKVILLGENCVGKTSILIQFIEQTFQDDIHLTTGGLFSIKYAVCDNNKILKFEIWDTTGREKYHSLSTMYYKDAKAAILVYDITRDNTFEEIKNFWTKQLKEFCKENIILIIAGNKSDLIEQEETDEEEVRNYAKEINAIFVSTSAKCNEGINELFEEIAKKYTGTKNIKMEDSLEQDK